MKVHHLMNPRSLAALSAIGACLLCGNAQAGPRVTETADALPTRDCELEAGTTRERVSGVPALRIHEAVFGCGVGFNTQVNVGWARATFEGESASGYALMGKTTYVMPEAGRTGWGLAYGLAAVRNSSNSLRWQEAAVSLVATRELAGNWLMHANLGVSHDRDAKLNTTIWSLGVESTDTLALAADVFGDDRSRPWLSGGVGYSLGGGLSASVRVAQQFEQPRVRSVSVGVKLVF